MDNSIFTPLYKEESLPAFFLEAASKYKSGNRLSSLSDFAMRQLPNGFILDLKVEEKEEYLSRA